MQYIHKILQKIHLKQPFYLGKSHTQIELNLLLPIRLKIKLRIYHILFQLKILNI